MKNRVNNTNDLYKLWFPKNRNIEVVFNHIPGKRISTGTKDVSEAINFAENYLKNDGVVYKEMPLLKDFCKDFFTSETPGSFYQRDVSFGREKRKLWYSKAQLNVDLYILPKFGSYPLDSISMIAIENWLISLKGRKVKDLSSATRNKILNLLRFILDDAVRLGYISSNPARMVKGPTVHPKVIRRALTIHEQKILFPDSVEERIKIWKDVRWATFFSIMYDTGFRPAEILGLLIGDVYSTPKGMAVYTTHSFSSDEKELKNRVKTTGKGMESRVGLLSEITQKLLLLLLDKLPDQTRKEDEPLFRTKFSTSNYKFITCWKSNRFFTIVCAKYGITDVTQYCLRHTYATYRRGNLNENSLALAMGHSNGVRDDYDHRTAAILISQLENERERLFATSTDDGIKKICKS